MYLKKVSTNDSQLLRLCNRIFISELPLSPMRGIIPFYSSFLDELLSKKVSFFLIFSATHTPLSLVIIQRHSSLYGSFFLILNKNTNQDIEKNLDICIQNKHFSTLLEIGYLGKTTDTIINILKRKNLICNHRQRMAYFLDTVPKINHSLLQDISVHYVDKNFITETSVIAFNAHQLSGDYDMYSELTNLQKRIAMQKRIFQGFYGKVLKKGTFGLFKNKKILGYCITIEIPNIWRYPNIPWIFDIVVDPLYQGQGYGRLLLNLLLSYMHQEKFEIIGLSVTKNNAIAKYIYDSVGFIELDEFYEFIEKKSLLI